MKKFVKLALVAVASSMMFISCAFNTKVSKDVGIPSHVEEIQFYNGGACILDTKGPADIETEIQTNTKLVGKNISFYIYNVIYENEAGVTKRVSIMDSEALSAIWEKNDE